jgi:putative ABC transport system permease protein
MFKHLFKMIWNKKKQNSLLIVEILLSFLVIFAVFSFALNSYNNYAKPMGFNYDMFGPSATTIRWKPPTPIR